MYHVYRSVIHVSTFSKRHHMCVVDIIVKSLHPTFHKHNHGESRFVIEAILGVGIRICYSGVFIDKIYVEWENTYSYIVSLADNYFTSQLDRCSCESCWSARDDDAYQLRGEPPKKYSLPRGWCRFGLRLA